MTGAAALSLAPIAAEVVLAAAACAVLVVEVYGRSTDLTYRLSQASLVLTALVLALNFPEGAVVAFSGTFVADPMAAILKLATLVIGWFYVFWEALLVPMFLIIGIWGRLNRKKP